jgi:hypothetical protein
MSWLSEGIRKVRKGKVGRFFDRHLDEMGTVAGFALGGPGGAAIGRMAGSSVGAQREKTLRGFAKKGMQGYAAGSLASAVPGVNQAAQAAGNRIGGSVGQRIASQATQRMGANVAGNAAANAAPGGVTPPASAPNLAGSAGANIAPPSGGFTPMGGMPGGVTAPGIGQEIAQKTPSALNRVGSTLFGSPTATASTLQGAGMLAQGAGAYSAGKVEDRLGTQQYNLANRRMSLEEEEVARRRQQEQNMAQFMSPWAQDLGRTIQQRMANQQPYQFQPYQRPGA